MKTLMPKVQSPIKTTNNIQLEQTFLCTARAAMSFRTAQSYALSFTAKFAPQTRCSDAKMLCRVMHRIATPLLDWI
eukprot:6492375-Amphidinium_carterae.4